MAQIRYRTGLDATTGAPLAGWDHVRQSLMRIWTTRPGERLMRLGFGAVLRDRLGEDITPELALGIYDDLVRAAHAFEPEYRLTELQFVRLARDGSLGLRHGGIYYPHGRFGDYSLGVPVTAGATRFGSAA